MDEWESDLQKQMFPDENVISYIANLQYSFKYPPYVDPDSDLSTTPSMRMILTNRRLLTRFWNGSVRKWFYTSLIHSITERNISNDQPNWPYQAILIISGGLILIVQTEKVDINQQEDLSNLLHKAFIMFCSKGEDLDSIVTAIVSEQQSRSDQSNNEPKK